MYNKYGKCTQAFLFCICITVSYFILYIYRTYITSISVLIKIYGEKPVGLKYGIECQLGQDM